MRDCPNTSIIATKPNAHTTTKIARRHTAPVRLPLTAVHLPTPRPREPVAAIPPGLVAPALAAPPDTAARRRAHTAAPHTAELPGRARDRSQGPVCTCGYSAVRAPPE